MSEALIAALVVVISAIRGLQWPGGNMAWHIPMAGEEAHAGAL